MEVGQVGLQIQRVDPAAGRALDRGLAVEPGLLRALQWSRPSGGYKVSPSHLADRNIGNIPHHLLSVPGVAAGKAKVPVEGAALWHRSTQSLAQRQVGEVVVLAVVVLTVIVSNRVTAGVVCTYNM